MVETTDKMKTEDYETLFVAGAFSKLEEKGYTEKEAESVVSTLLKQAAPRYYYEGEDDDSTWWSRNKSWMIPTLVGSAAFMVGNDAGRNGRKDRGALTNAGALLWKRVKALFGIVDDPMWTAMTETTK